MSPLFGGVIYHAAGRYAVFGTTMALIAVDAILRLLMVAEPIRPREDQVDSVERTKESRIDSIFVANGDHLASGKISSTTSQWPSNQPMPVEEVPIARVTGILRLIRSPRLLAALYGIFLNEVLNASLMSVIPLFVDRTFGWNTLGAGLVFLTIAIPSIGGFLAGSLSDRFGPKRVAVSGLLITGPTVILLRLVRHKMKQQMVLFCGLLTIIGESHIFLIFTS
jgi:hypothetical protein